MSSRRQWMTMGLALFAGAAFGAYLLRSEPARALQLPPQNQPQWQAAAMMPAAQPGNGSTTAVFTVPVAINPSTGLPYDLTITDISYDFGDTRVSTSEDIPVDGYFELYVWDGGPNNNPTINKTTPPLVFNTTAQASDRAGFRFLSDRVKDGLLESVGPSLTPVGVGDLTPRTMGDSSLDFRHLMHTSISRHFQTGILIPSGNTVNVTTTTLGVFPASAVFNGFQRVILRGGLF